MTNKQKKYFIDTNIILRYLLHDNEEQFSEIKELLLRQDQGKVSIKCVTQVVIEAIHVLSSFYKVPRYEVSKMMGDYVKSAPIEIENRNGLIWMIEMYGRTKLGLVDALLLEKVKSEGGEIFSFDKKLIKEMKKLT